MDAGSEIKIAFSPLSAAGLVRYLEIERRLTAIVE